MTDRWRHREYEQLIVPHLDAAYNLARWMVKNDADAEDLVQDACVRALKFLETFRGVNARSWLLSIVRNTCYSWLRQKSSGERQYVEFNEEVHGRPEDSPDPATLTEQQLNWEMLKKALEEIPDEFREVLILRELEECSYKEIAEITGVPLGTVMSRLARARTHLHRKLLDCTKGE